MDGVSLALNWYLNNNMNLMIDCAYDNRYDMPVAATARPPPDDPGPHERRRRQAAVPILAIGPKNLNSYRRP